LFRLRAFAFSFSEKSGYISVILVPDELERQIEGVTEETQITAEYTTNHPSNTHMKSINVKKWVKKFHCISRLASITSTILATILFKIQNKRVTANHCNPLFLLAER